MESWKGKSLILSGFILLISIVTIPDVEAKTPKKCTKIGGSYLPEPEPGPVLCKDGSPNLNIFEILLRTMPRTMNLKANASDKQIKAAICEDEKNNYRTLPVDAAPTVEPAVKYMFAWREFRSQKLSYRSIMKAYYGGEKSWKAFCSKG
jgi:hypothetical protein